MRSTIQGGTKGSEGDPPALLGDSPSGMGDATAGNLDACNPFDVAAIPSSESPDGTGQWPVLPNCRSSS